jgi:hypothetical protein
MVNGGSGIVLIYGEDTKENALKEAFKDKFNVRTTFNSITGSIELSSTPSQYTYDPEIYYDDSFNNLSLSSIEN